MKEVGVGFKKEGIYVYLWPIQLMSGKNHNIVKQLSSKLVCLIKNDEGNFFLQ